MNRISNFSAKAFHLTKGSSLAASFVLVSPMLLSKIERFLLFLVGAGFLSVVLTACAGGGGGSGGSSSGSANNGSMDGGPGDNGLGNGGGDGQGVFNASLTFAPIRGGFQIGSQSDFSNFTSLKITATSGSEVVERSINIDEFDDDSYDFTGLAELDWKFQIIGILSDGGEREVDIAFVWQENEDDHGNDGIRSGLDTDGDRRADSVDEDDDNDAYRDDVDVDDDGDGLIEIATAAQLDEVRYALDGSGRRSTDDGLLDSTGCGDGTAITLCSGYELVANISLGAYTNWQPLGHDNDTSTSGCQGAALDVTFEGNGWTISDLSIDRSGEDCVGLFGHIAGDSEIRNLRLSAGRVRGKSSVGGIVGSSQNATIIYSSILVSEVIGDGSVGGLAGGITNSQIFSSSVVAGRVRSSGLVTGGLVGGGSSARIHSSSVVVGQLSAGNGAVGGLVGFGEDARIISSSVVVGEVSGSTGLGGLTGIFNSVEVAYSYVVSGSNIAIMASGGTETGVASYWDSDTSGRDSGTVGEAKTSNQLREPTGYTGIYANWTDDTDIFGDGMSDDPFAVWCDEDNNGIIEMDERVDGNRIWDFGTSSQYPAIRCTPLAPAEWRSWWSLDENGNPALNQTRLDALSN